jgi:hypothetical protein
MNSLEVLMFLFFTIVIIGLGYLIVVKRREGFLNGSAVGTGGPRCGVDFPACPMGMRCVNGYCAPVDPPRMPVYSDLPVLPIGPINGRN